jgi:integrase
MGSRQVSTLRPKDFSFLYDALVGRMNLSPGSVSLVHSMLRAMFNWGWRREIVQDNPVLRADHPSKSWVPPVAPERDEVMKHCSILREENPDLGLAVWMVATLGLRRSEVLALRWSHINFDQKVITINEGITKTPGLSYVVTSTKTGASGHAKFPLHPYTAQELLEMLSKLQSKLVEVGLVALKDAFIFSSDFAHEIPWNPDTISHAVSKHCERHPEVPRLTLRLLRRYGVSDLAGEGVDEVTASAILRNGPETARRHYQAVRHDQVRSATLGIADRLLKCA